MYQICNRKPFIFGRSKPLPYRVQKHPTSNLQPQTVRYGPSGTPAPTGLYIHPASNLRGKHSITDMVGVDSISARPETISYNKQFPRGKYTSFSGRRRRRPLPFAKTLCIKFATVNSYFREDNKKGRICVLFTLSYIQTFHSGALFPRPPLQEEVRAR